MKKIMLLGMSVILAQGLNAQVSEAFSGFQMPVDFTPSTSGFHFLDDTVEENIPSGVNPYPGCGGSTIYHPGEDMNKAGGGDDGLPIYAVADGKVVRVVGSGWRPVVIEHFYKGKTYYSLYGHGNMIVEEE